MWKFIVMVAVGSAFLSWWPSVAENQDGRPHTKRDQAAKTQEPAPPVHVIIDNPPQSTAKPNNQEQAAAEKPLPRFERPEWVIVYITAVYSLIAGLTLVAIWRQAKIMEKQAADMRRSAADAATIAQGTLNAIERQVINLRRQVIWMRMSYRASKLNAEAAMLSAKTASADVEAFRSSERAWLILYPDPVAFAPVTGESPMFWWRIKNVGRTTAELVETQAVLWKKDELHKLPTPPNYGDPINLNGRILAPNEATTAFNTYCSDWDAGRQKFRINRTRFDASQGLYFVAFGYAKYRSLGQMCESRFIVYGRREEGEYRPIQFRDLLGDEVPLEYTKQT